MARSIAAADRKVTAGIDGKEQFRQKFRWVLLVGVHNAQNRRIGVLPAVENGPGKAPLPLADQEAHARIFLGRG